MTECNSSTEHLATGDNFHQQPSDPVGILSSAERIIRYHYPVWWCWSINFSGIIVIYN